MRTPSYITTAPTPETKTSRCDRMLCVHLGTDASQHSTCPYMWLEVPYTHTRRIVAYHRASWGPRRAAGCAGWAGSWATYDGQHAATTGPRQTPLGPPGPPSSASRTHHSTLRACRLPTSAPAPPRTFARWHQGAPCPYPLPGTPKSPRSVAAHVHRVLHRHLSFPPSPTCPPRISPCVLCPPRRITPPAPARHPASAPAAPGRTRLPRRPVGRPRLARPRPHYRRSPRPRPRPPHPTLPNPPPLPRPTTDHP